MGRPPCCDKVGVKKGPWTPEEDIILVSYIQEHGPGNWRSVPTNTGLLRCSKSCRLRWTNYLRPGIKRGNFTPHEEGMIIHLQALLGNKWAAIASYLPQRTDNDIKNYWNTHLKKKLKKFQSSLEVPNNNNNNINMVSSSSDIPTTSTFVSTKSSSLRSLSNQQMMMVSSTNSTTYASSTENISRLLEGWMRSSPKDKLIINQSNGGSESDNEVLNNNYRPKVEQFQGGGEMISSEEFESILSFDNLNNNVVVGDWDNNNNNKSSCYSTIHKSCQLAAAANTDDHEMAPTMSEKKQRSSSSSDQNNNNNPPLSILENWLFDETSGHVEEIMQLSPIF